MRELFSSLDADDNAILDKGELLLGLGQVLGVNMMNVDLDKLFWEADLNENEEIDYQVRPPRAGLVSALSPPGTPCACAHSLNQVDSQGTHASSFAGV